MEINYDMSKLSKIKDTKKRPKLNIKNYQRVLQSILSREEPERNRSNKQHDGPTVIRTFIVMNMVKTTRCDKSLTP